MVHPFVRAAATYAIKRTRFAAEDGVRFPYAGMTVNINRRVRVFHDLADATAVLRAGPEGAPLTMISPPGAAAYWGAGYFLALIEAAEETAPRAGILWVLDCADGTGDALAAIRSGVPGLVYTGPAGTGEKLREMADAAGVRFFNKRPEESERPPPPLSA